MNDMLPAFSIPALPTPNGKAKAAEADYTSQDAFPIGPQVQRTADEPIGYGRDGNRVDEDNPGRPFPELRQLGTCGPALANESDDYKYHQRNGRRGEIEGALGSIVRVEGPSQSAKPEYSNDDKENRRSASCCLARCHRVELTASEAI